MAMLPRLISSSTPASEISPPITSGRARRRPKKASASTLVTTGMKELSRVALVAVVYCTATYEKVL